jgi:putative ABC transport system permease protein
MTAVLQWVSETLRRLSFRTRRASLNQELREEMEFHLEMLARDNEARGMSREAAREAARKQFGSETLLRESSRSHWSLGWIDAVWQDARYSARSLIRTPAVTLNALLTLSLGIGATVTVVALLDATLLHPIALRDVDRIVTICQTNQGSGCSSLSPGNYISIRRTPTVIQDVALSQYWDVALSGRVSQVPAEGARVTLNYFSVLGVTPLLGRFFTQADADASSSHITVVVLSYAFWQLHFNGDPNVIGSAISLSGIPRTVIGVLRKDDGFPSSSDIWAPLTLPATAANDRESVNSLVVGRLRPGATVADAARDVEAIQQRLVRKYPSSNAGWRFIAAPLKQFRTGDIREAVLLIVGAVVGVLLIACANVANLLLVRASARDREISVRAALGAGRAQVARQLLIEGLMLSLIGGIFGVILGEVGVVLLRDGTPALFAGYLPGWKHLGINWHVLEWILGLCVVIGVGFSAFPAFRAARTDLTGALKQGSHGSTGGRHVAWIRTILVTCEIALSVILLAAAGLLIQSFVRVTAASTGLNPDHVLTMHLQFPSTMNPSQVLAYENTAMLRLQSLPGVRRAAYIDRLPLSNSNSWTNFIPDSRPTLLFKQAPLSREQVVSQDYFRVMGIPLISGREFNESDRDTTISVVIVNRTLANRYWPGGDALGHTIGMNFQGRNFQGRTTYTIVGVVGDVAYEGADAPPSPEVYHPMQFARSWSTDVAIQTIGDPASMSGPAVRTVSGADPSVAITGVMTMDAMIARHYSYSRILADGLGIFALIALVIAVAGIYGVVAYGVSQRTQEIGVRMALGAKHHAVIRMILVETARIAVVGVVIGIIGAWFTGKALAFLLYGVAPRDPVTLIIVAMILTAVALAASYFPARRAGRVEPVVALRYE